MSVAAVGTRRMPLPWSAAVQPSGRQSPATVAGVRARPRPGERRLGLAIALGGGRGRRPSRCCSSGCACRSVHTGYQLSAARHLAHRLEQEQRELELEIATLTSPRRLEHAGARASRHGAAGAGTDRERAVKARILAVGGGIAVLLVDGRDAHRAVHAHRQPRPGAPRAPSASRADPHRGASRRHPRPPRRDARVERRAAVAVRAPAAGERGRSRPSASRAQRRARTAAARGRGEARERRPASCG